MTKLIKIILRKRMDNTSLYCFEQWMMMFTNNNIHVEFPTRLTCVITLSFLRYNFFPECKTKIILCI